MMMWTPFKKGREEFDRLSELVKEVGKEINALRTENADLKEQVNTGQ